MGWPKVHLDLFEITTHLPSHEPGCRRPLPRRTHVIVLVETAPQASDAMRRRDGSPRRDTLCRYHAAHTMMSRLRPGPLRSTLATTSSFPPQRHRYSDYAHIFGARRVSNRPLCPATTPPFPPVPWPQRHRSSHSAHIFGKYLWNSWNVPNPPLLCAPIVLTHHRNGKSCSRGEPRRRAGFLQAVCELMSASTPYLDYTDLAPSFPWASKTRPQTPGICLDTHHVGIMSSPWYPSQL
ncbi:hypothetical protein Hypma_014232 [Hypsizygus marmoreus]|uniref:Uncharacterized protein n=1 Tax=Hypsizygus marmoreus TaxID=39966 RepID=A0A369JK07_HYPMA|nr:hypothetical protein Hypma_014232 [Hypsizygus marmoreus]